MTDTLSKSQRSRVMAAVRSRDTTPELVVRRLVHALGYRFRLHVRELPGTPDLVFAKRGKVINVNGCFWHLHGCRHCRVPDSKLRYWSLKLQGNQRRDRRTRRQLRRAGWQVLVVWECQTRTPRLATLRARIDAFLSSTDHDAPKKSGNRRGDSGRRRTTGSSSRRA